jgi:glyoxylase-like metal-dependent hydrolase (beta-lactamase superfamily II)
MYPTVDVISIGHLSRNPFWNETEPVRPSLATTTLIRAGEKTILVDPSLPGELMVQRLRERSGLTPDRIDFVFLTSFHPTHRRGLAAFDDAKWLIGPKERETVADHLNDLLENDGSSPSEMIENELAILGRTEAAPDTLIDGVDLFPSPGVTAGHCGLLIAELRTILIAGDTVLTRAHLELNQISECCDDPVQAAESLAEVYEIADVIIPGHDNLFVVRGGY